MMKNLTALVVLIISAVLLAACAVPAEVVATPTPQWMEPEPMDIRDYVRQYFPETIPYEETVETYDASVVPILLEMLADPKEEANWTNIVIVLNMVGDDSVADPLIAFIDEEVEGELSYEHYHAKTAALMTLGYLVNRTGNEKALDYLIQRVSPASWEASRSSTAADFHESEVQAQSEFSQYAILGLGLSGNPEAAAVLESLQAPGAFSEMGMDAAFEAQASDTVSQALNDNQAIAEEGLAGYYRGVDEVDEVDEDEEQGTVQE